MAPDPLKLATLPIRVGLRVVGGVIGTASEVVQGTVELVKGTFGEHENGDRAAAVPPAQEAPRSEAPPPLAPREPGTAPLADPPSAFVEQGPADEPEPVHVEVETVVVAESADPEIADGIHSDLRVQEPWDGYSGQTAAEVIAALEDASPAQVGVVQLYESTHRARKTVLDAAARRLRSS